MPIYEFYCGDCHRLFSFLSRTIRPDARPDCPRCGRARLGRRPSVFAVSRGLKEREPGEEGLPDLDEARLEQAMESLAGDLDGIDENNPRQAAALMRRLFDSTGMPVGASMEEALRRMEAGEDPDRIEEELGDALEADPLGGGAESGALGRRAARLRKLLPPTVDPKLYEL